MWKYLCFFAVVFGSNVLLAVSDVWPKPQREQKGTEVYLFDPASFKFKVEGTNCPLMQRAIERYELIIGRQALNASDLEYLLKMTQLYSPLRELTVYLNAACEQYPHVDMDESYSLIISRESELRSRSVWGALRGLDTFAQLLEPVSGRYRVKRIRATNIEDSPRYAHRGFLLDSARHYFSAAFVLALLDALAANKLNVLHWHLTDAESFPYHSDRLPELSAYGAFYTYRIYDKRAIRKIVDYAADRGIRVIPEIDMPAHTRSWGKSHPEVLVACRSPGGSGPGAGTGMLNPIRNATYRLVRQLLGELQELFPDKYIHMGGNDVNLQCWIDDDDVSNYFYDIDTMFDRFIGKTAQFLADRSPIYWEDVYRAGVALPSNSLVQIWQDGRAAEESADVVRMILTGGWRVVYSRKWHLGSETATLEQAYGTDPRSGFLRRSGRGGRHLLHQIVGGEACLWSHGVDATNFYDRLKMGGNRKFFKYTEENLIKCLEEINEGAAKRLTCRKYHIPHSTVINKQTELAWPQAAAIAEVLWSARDLHAPGAPAVPLARLREHITRMHDRGLPVNLNSRYLRH